MPSAPPVRRALALGLHGHPPEIDLLQRDGIGPVRHQRVSESN